MSEQKILESFKYSDMMMFSIKSMKPYTSTDKLRASNVMEETCGIPTKVANIEVTRLYQCDGTTWKLLQFDAFLINDLNSGNKKEFTVVKTFGDMSEKRLGVINEFLSKNELSRYINVDDVLVLDKEKIEWSLGVKLICEDCK